MLCATAVPAVVHQREAPGCSAPPSARFMARVPLEAEHRAQVLQATGYTLGLEQRHKTLQALFCAYSDTVK